MWKHYPISGIIAFMSNLIGIDVFVKVVQCGSFTGAAKLLGMPVTTVSGKIRNLEDRIGQTLILRTTRKLSITDAGKLYFEHCLKAIEEVGEAERALQSKQSEPEGTLRITAAPDIGHVILPNLLKKYLHTYPNVNVELILTNRIVDLVGESIDIAIRPGALKDSTLIARKFIEGDALLWASPEYLKAYGVPKKPADLVEHKFVTFKPLGTSIKLKNGKISKAVKMKSRITLDDFEAAKIFTTIGTGIGLIPDFLCRQEQLANELVRILPDWSLDLGRDAKGQVSFVYPPHKYTPPKVQAFVKMALESIRT